MANHIVTDIDTAIKKAVSDATLAERTRTMRRFMMGCNSMLLRQIGAGSVEVRLGSDGHVRLVEGSQL